MSSHFVPLSRTTRGETRRPLQSYVVAYMHAILQSSRKGGMRSKGNPKVSMKDSDSGRRQSGSLSDQYNSHREE